MNVEGVLDSSNIYSLPDEIIILILQNSSNRDILNFSATCKRYNDVVKSHTSLWRSKCATMFPSIICEVIANFHNSNWLEEMKHYSILKQNLYNELMNMSPKHYWMLSERSLDNVNEFFDIVTQRNFFYAIHILQDVIQIGNKLIDQYECKKPYTMTEMYYSKAVLRQFIHNYLAVKWTKSKLENNLPPEIVVNFFMQWIDPAVLYLDEEVNRKIDFFVEQVNKILQNDKNAHGQCSNMQIVHAVSEVIYKQSGMSLSSGSDFDSFNICKTIDKKCGSVTVVAAIYQAVATRCGAKVELIIFPNHLFLQLKDDNPHENQRYNINLGTGELYPKRQCPFASAQPNPPIEYSYSPDTLLTHLYSSYMVTMGALRTWNTENAIHLLDFLGIENEQAPHSPCKHYYSYLMENPNTLLQCGDSNLKQLSGEYMMTMSALAFFNKVDELPIKQKVIKRQDCSVRFAVGMFCYHRTYDYICVIRGWDLAGCQLHFALDDLYFGQNQPFYYITAADQSQRYVPQEKLKALIRPTRLYILEHQISRDFTHFDGFVYVANDEKKTEFPDNEKFVEAFRTFCKQTPIDF